MVLGKRISAAVLRLLVALLSKQEEESRLLGPAALRHSA